jgi:hypothetical protein
MYLCRNNQIKHVTVSQNQIRSKFTIKKLLTGLYRYLKVLKKILYCRISVEWEYIENITLKIRTWNRIHIEFATRKR